MKPDAYMPFYGDDFFSATRGWSGSMRDSYLACLWHYWSHTHAEGLPDDDDQLWRLCGCEMQNWARTKGLIFDNDKFFRLENGRWHQKRAKEEYQAALDDYNEKLTASRLGVEARRRLGQLPPIEAAVQPPVEPDVNLTRTIDRETERAEIELPPGFPKTEQDAKTAAAFVGCSESFSVETWNKAMGRGGNDAKGQPIRSWPHYLKSEDNFNKSRLEKEKKQHGNNAKNYQDRNAGTYNEGRASKPISKKIR